MSKPEGLPLIAARKLRPVADPSAPMNKVEAQAWAADVRNGMERVIALLKKGHDRWAWRALGYETWQACCEAEFGISRQRAYQLLGAGEVAQKLTEAVNSALPAGTQPVQIIPVPASTMVDNRPLTSANTPEILHVVPLTEREARDVEPVLPKVARSIKQRVRHGVDGAKAVRDAIEAARPPKRPKPVMEGQASLFEGMQAVDSVVAEALDETEAGTATVESLALVLRRIHSIAQAVLPGRARAS